MITSHPEFKLINSWDHFVIPFPFSKGVYTFGEQISVDKKINKKKFEISRLEVENEIKRLTKLINNESN